MDYSVRYVRMAMPSISVTTFTARASSSVSGSTPDAQGFIFPAPDGSDRQTTGDNSDAPDALCPLLHFVLDDLPVAT